MKFSSKDLYSCIITGLLTGFSAWQIAEFLEVKHPMGLSFAWFLVIVPILWIIGVNFGYLLGKAMPFFNQFGRFAAVGFTNAAVDFGILYLLIGISGTSSGAFYSGFKAISFLIAAAHSYIWNKIWVFDAGSTKNSGQEMTKFFAVSVTSAFINVIVASVIVNLIGPQFGLADSAWAGIGAVVGSATALAFSFVGFRLIVFRKR